MSEVFIEVSQNLISKNPFANDDVKSTNIWAVPVSRINFVTDIDGVQTLSLSGNKTEPGTRAVDSVAPLDIRPTDRNPDVVGIMKAASIQMLSTTQAKSFEQFTANRETHINVGQIRSIKPNQKEKGTTVTFYDGQTLPLYTPYEAIRSELGPKPIAVPRDVA